MDPRVPSARMWLVMVRPSTGRVALLLIDVINGFDFAGSERLVEAASRAAPNIRRLADRARNAGASVIYVNDNFGRWRSDFRATIAACTAPGQPGRDVSRQLLPHDGDLFVLKPQQSGFFSTSLDLLLSHLEVCSLVLAGFATNLCITFTAQDAHMRGYQIWTPSDCTASNTPALTRDALAHLRRAVQARTPKARSIRFEVLGRQRRKQAASGATGPRPRSV
jgi:nicotinamidase-related amidase